MDTIVFTIDTIIVSIVHPIVSIVVKNHSVNPASKFRLKTRCAVVPLCEENNSNRPSHDNFHTHIIAPERVRHKTIRVGCVFLFGRDSRNFPFPLNPA